MGSGAATAAPLSPHDSNPLEPEKLFKCPVCSRIFNKKANLKVHSRKHTGEKPYACSKPGCGRAFMWKSSVTFHEQNCPSTKKDAAPLIPVATKGVQKRPKSNLPRVANDDDDDDWSLQSRTPPVHRPKKRAPKAPLPTTPISPEDAIREHEQNRLREDAATAAHPFVQSFPKQQPPVSAPQRTALDAPAFQATVSFSSGLAVSPLPLSPAPQTNAPFLADVLPAPTALLGEKRVGGGRPPVIPGSLPKHPFYGMSTHKENSSKPLFDLRVPASSSVSSGAKPPVMYNSSKMPKMPIAMELDDSDDEGTAKIIGAQDAFMRTGDPFRGFVPPTRCSPLPISSPIVCPGISPMPLSPLAPFSPLPPDSPAHNAPNPVHPPLNQPMRPNNTNW